MKPTSLIPQNHHAFLVAGELTKTWPVIKTEIEKDFFSGREFFSCPDAWIIEESSAGIELARELKNFASFRPVEMSTKILVVKLNFITEPAQNALLKTLEEPLGESRIFVLASSRQIFLPTILSRLLEIKLPVGGFDDFEKIKKFISATPAGRFKILEKEFSNERHLDRELVLSYLTGVENVFANMPVKEKTRAIENGWDGLPKIRALLFTEYSSPKQVGELLSSVLG